MLKFLKKFPTLKQWEKFFNILRKKEKIFFLVLFLLAIVSALFLDLNFYFKNTQIIPRFGGEFKEGVIGQPRFINPLLLSDNDPDRDLIELLFSGLLKYNDEGKIVKDLAQDYQIQENNKDYEFQIRDDALWQDGEKITSEDIIFTIELVQSPYYKSPLRIEWLSIKAEALTAKKVVFHLQKPYSSFLETVARLKILPKHIFEDISAENFPWAFTSKKYLQGSGPFKIKNIKEDKLGYIQKIIMERNEKFFGEKPFLKKISFYFYQNLEDLLKAARVGEIDGFSISEPKYFNVLEKEGFNLFKLVLPRYFALFFNLKNSDLLDKNIREALSYSVDKQEILDKVFLGQGKIINSPVLADYYGFEPPIEISEFNIEKANEILEQEGFEKNLEKGIKEKIVIKEIPAIFKSELKQGSRSQEVRDLQKCLANPPAGGKDIYPEGEITGYFGTKTKKAVIRFQEKYAEDILSPIGLKNGTGKVGAMTRKKLNQVCQEIPKKIIPLTFTITTSDTFPLTEIVEILKTQFEKIGAEVKIKKASLSEFQTNILIERDFEVLLFGEALGQLPDPFPFWHSSQNEYPGLNIGSYNSKQADKLLEKARETIDETERKENLEKFQNVLIEDKPAFFLTQASYCYFLSPKIKGFAVEKITEPSKRFINIGKWYSKTKRKWY